MSVLRTCTGHSVLSALTMAGLTRALCLLLALLVVSAVALPGEMGDAGVEMGDAGVEMGTAAPTKPGTCPEPPFTCRKVAVRDDCKSNDYNCKENEKCCPWTCGKECVALDQ